MTIQEFLMLNEMEQVCQILQSGTLLTQNIRIGERTFVYRLQSFYVSASYDRFTDQLTEIRCFLDIAHVVPEHRRQINALNPAEREYETPA